MFLRYFIILFLLVSGGVKADAAELKVFAPANLSDVLNGVNRNFALNNSSKVYSNFDSTSALRVQIENGAPCDVFLSDDKGSVDKLIAKGLVDPAQAKAFMTNLLVVIVPAGSKEPEHIQDLKQLSADKIVHFAVADPQSVPAGIYAKEALTKLEMWDVLKDKIVPALDVKAAMALVENGNAQAGIVYLSDVMNSDKVRIIYQIPPDSHAPIEYWAAVMKNSHDAGLAGKYIEHLLSADKAREAFTKSGFFLPHESASGKQLPEVQEK